jgi:hypothetical protein
MKICIKFSIRVTLQSWRISPAPKKLCKKRVCVTTTTSRTLLASFGCSKHPRPCNVNHLVAYSMADICFSRGPGRCTTQDPSRALSLRKIFEFHRGLPNRPSSAGIRWIRIPRCITGARAWVAVWTARSQGEDRMCVINGACWRNRCAKSSHSRLPRSVSPPSGRWELDLCC